VHIEKSLKLGDFVDMLIALGDWVAGSSFENDEERARLKIFAIV